jgi:hypothetical protein
MQYQTCGIGGQLPGTLVGETLHPLEKAVTDDRVWHPKPVAARTSAGGSLR